MITSSPRYKRAPKKAVQLYQRHPVAFQVGTLATVGLLLYLNRREREPQDANFTLFT